MHGNACEEIELIGKSFAHWIAVTTGARLPHTQTTPPEREFLARHLPGLKCIVEIGVYEGFTTRLLVDASDSDATVYGVDPFSAGRLGVCWGLLIAERHNREHLASGKLNLIRALSTQVGEKVPSIVDFVFIDADHSLAGIEADWDFWSARVRPGGIIALHDTLLTRDRPAELGSHQYFRSHIQHDSRFCIVGQVESLSVLSKR